MNPVRMSVWLLIGVLTSNLLLLPMDRVFAQTTQAPQSSVAMERVNINKATAVELEAIRGVGPALASRIVAYRDEHGKFQSLEELPEVRGIGVAKLERIKEQISL